MHVEWTVIEYSYDHINKSFTPISQDGALKCCYANSGQVIAVAANQNIPENTRMLFVSPLTDTVISCDMKGCGLRDPRHTKGRFVNAYSTLHSDAEFIFNDI